MPRDVNGTYTLPAGNPVQPDTVIDVDWANPTMTDLATAMTNSLSRNGNGGMLAPFQNSDGVVALPGMTWANEPSSGWYRSGTGEAVYSTLGTNAFRITAAGAFVWKIDQWVLLNSGLSIPDGVSEDQTQRWDTDTGTWVPKTVLQLPAQGAPLDTDLVELQPANGDPPVSVEAISFVGATGPQGETGATGASGRDNVTPIIEPYQFGAAYPLVLGATSYVVPGFVGDGDYVTLPTARAGNISYYDRDGLLIWSYLYTDWVVSATDWQGFTMDPVDALMYVVVTVPGDATAIGTVDVAGTLVLIGSAVNPGPFFTTAALWSQVNAGTSTIQREADGSGDMHIRTNQAAGMQGMSLSTVDGSITSPVSTISPGIFGPYKTTDGIFMATTGVPSIGVMDSDYVYPVTNVSTQAGFGGGIASQSIPKVIRWNGYAICVSSTSAGAFSDSRAWGSDAMDTFMLAIKALYV
jgi:hypothetical protein